MASGPLLIAAALILLGLISSHPAVLETGFSVPTSLSHYEVIEPMVLGSIVLCTVCAVLVSAFLDMAGSGGVRPFTVQFGADCCWEAVRGFAHDSSLVRIFNQDGVRGVLQHVGGSIVTAFRESCVYRLYRWFVFHQEVIYATVAGLPITLYLAHGNLEPVYAYLAGFEAGFRNVFATQSSQCRYFGHSSAAVYDLYTHTAFLSCFCKGEVDGLDTQMGWEHFAEDQVSNLNFLIHISRIASGFAALGFVMAWLVYRTDFGPVRVRTVLQAFHTAQEVMQTENVNKSGAGPTGSQEDAGESSSDNDNQSPGDRQRELDGSSGAPGDLSSTQSEGPDHAEVLALRNTVQDLDGAKQLAVERQTAAEKRCEELSAFLQQARQYHTQEERAKRLAIDKYTAFRKLADTTADQGLLPHFRAFDNFAETPGSAPGLEELAEYRKAIDTEFPALLERATAFREAERNKVVECANLLETERHRTVELETRLADVTKEGQEQSDRASAAAADIDAMRREHQALVSAYDALNAEKGALVEEATAAVADRDEEIAKCGERIAADGRRIAGRDEQLDLLMERNDEMLQEILLQDGASANMSCKIRQLAAKAMVADEAENGDDKGAKEEIRSSVVATTPGSLQLEVDRSADREGALKAELDRSANREGDLKAELDRSANREETLKAELEKANSQLAEKVSQETEAQATQQQRFADAASREEALRTELDGTKQALVDVQSQAASWEANARLEADTLVQKHQAALTTKDEEHQREVNLLKVHGQEAENQVNDLQNRIQERETEARSLRDRVTVLERDIRQRGRDRWDNTPLQNAQVEIAEKQTEINSLRRQLDYTSQTSGGERANARNEQLRNRVRDLEATERNLTSVRIDLTRRLQAAEQEAQRARIALSNKSAGQAKAGLVQKKVNPLQATVTGLQKQLADSQTDLAEMTVQRDEAVAAAAAAAEAPPTAEPTAPPPLVPNKRARTAYE